MTTPASTVARRSRLQAALLSAVRFYQRAISPTRPARCRFVPTCSAYALEAVEVHGALRGGWLALRRLAKCAPWHPGGVDLVPEPAPGPRSGTSEAAHSSNTAARSAGSQQQTSAVPAVEGRALQPALLPAASSSTAGPRPGPAAGDLR